MQTGLKAEGDCWAKRKTEPVSRKAVRSKQVLGNFAF